MFLDMGGYAAFVWPAYGIVAVVMIGLVVTSLRRLRANEAAIAKLERWRGRRRSDGEGGQ